MHLCMSDSVPQALITFKKFKLGSLQGGINECVKEIYLHRV